MTTYATKKYKISITDGGLVSCDNAHIAELFQQMINNFILLFYSPDMGNKSGAFYEHCLRELGFVIEDQVQESIDIKDELNTF